MLRVEGGAYLVDGGLYVGFACSPRYCHCCAVNYVQTCHLPRVCCAALSSMMTPDAMEAAILCSAGRSRYQQTRWTHWPWRDPSFAARSEHRNPHASSTEIGSASRSRLQEQEPARD